MDEISLSATKGIDHNAQDYAEEFVNGGVTTSQLRRIYSEVKRAESEFKFDDDSQKARRTLVLLKPQLAYAASRNREMEQVKEVVTDYIDKAVRGNEKNMEVFFSLMEAIVAYHAYFEETGGRQ
jgi:CRISPR-associated protein Csm2